MMQTAGYEKYIKAGDPNVEVQELRSLLVDGNTRIRRRIASNPSTPEDILVLLSEDNDQEVRISVGRNPSTPKLTIERLSQDESPNVRYGLAADRFLPVEILKRLADDENAYVMNQAHRTLEGLALEDALKQVNFAHEPGDQARLGELLVGAELLTQKELHEYLGLSHALGLPLGHTVARTQALPRGVIVMSLQLQLLIRRGQLNVEEALNILKLGARSGKERLD